MFVFKMLEMFQQGLKPTHLRNGSVSGVHNTTDCQKKLASIIWGGADWARKRREKSGPPKRGNLDRHIVGNLKNKPSWELETYVRLWLIDLLI